MTNDDREVATQCVKRGARWLDAEVPDWAERVDLAALRMQDGDSDLTAQLGEALGPDVSGWGSFIESPNGKFMDGSYTLINGEQVKQAIAHGLIDHYGTWSMDYGLLDDLWRDEVLARNPSADVEGDEEEW